MSQLYKGTIKTVGESMARSTTDAHAFKIFMDEPEALGGKNAAPSPLDFILAAHGGCLNFMTFFIANEMGISIEGTEISISGEIDPGKFSGANLEVRAGYQSLAVTIDVKSSASEEEIEKLRAAVEARCPVSDNISNATPVTISMKSI
ncbi:MAG: OsmC family protein [Gammaproteobacteria bacterium]